MNPLHSPETTNSCTPDRKNIIQYVADRKAAAALACGRPTSTGRCLHPASEDVPMGRFGLWPGHPPACRLPDTGQGNQGHPAWCLHTEKRLPRLRSLPKPGGQLFLRPGERVVKPSPALPRASRGQQLRSPTDCGDREGHPPTWSLPAPTQCMASQPSACRQGTPHDATSQYPTSGAHSTSWLRHRAGRRREGILRPHPRLCGYAYTL